MGNKCTCCGAVHCRVELAKCLHAFCLPCSEKLLQSAELCPLDGEQVSFSSLSASSLGKSGAVPCSNAAYGCPFEGSSAADMQEHVVLDCLHNHVTCRSCKRQIALSQFDNHKEVCLRRSVSRAGFSRDTSLKRREEASVAQDAAVSSACAPEAVEATGKCSSPEGATLQEYDDEANSCAMEQTTLIKPKQPLHIGENAVRLARRRRHLVRQPHDVDSLEAGLAESLGDPVFPGSSGGNAAGTHGTSSNASRAQSPDASQVSQERKSPVRPKTLDLGGRRSPKLTVAALSAALAGTAVTLRTDDRTTPTGDMMSSLSNALKNITYNISDAYVMQQAKNSEGVRNFLVGSDKVSKCSSEHSTVTRLQTLKEPEGDDSEQEDQPSQLNALSAQRIEGASESSAAVGSWQSSSVHEAEDASQPDTIGHSSGIKTSEDFGAVESGATSSPGPSSVSGRASGPMETLLLLRHFRKVTFTFSNIVQVTSALDTESMVFAETASDVIYGYTFRVALRFQGLGGLIMLAFGFFFCSGEYDNLCRWPFDMNVFLQVVHPRTGARNMLVQLRPRRAVAAGAFCKPQSGWDNPRWYSQDYAWTSILKAGFVADGILRLEVWFE